MPLWASLEESRKVILSMWYNVDLIKVSENEVEFRTDGGDYEKDEVMMSLMHPGLKLLLVNVREKGCRYYTKMKKIGSGCGHCYEDEEIGI
ncbi:hypothetical protein SUGI_1140650 [Cryptomeria japonica]|nr:hypothetical protein SUGI_1140650 [Cryptomeria japonica]